MATLQSSSNLEFPWPEPLVIEIIHEHLAPRPLTLATRRTLARQHAAALEDMIACRADWPSSRRLLAERYHDVGIPRDCLAAIDRAVFFELTHIAADRFRTSPRRRHEAADTLRAAIGRLASQPATARRVAA